MTGIGDHGGIVREVPASVAARITSRGGVALVRKKALWVLGLIAVAVVLAACSPNNQQDSLDPKGPYAQKIDTLFQPVFWSRSPSS